MSTTNYQLGWKYYAAYTELTSNVSTYPSTRYTIIPVNGQLSLPSSVRFYAKDIFGHSTTLRANQVTLSGYDTSVAGEYQITATYVCPNGQILTNTDYYVRVFGTSSWRTLWTGSAKIALQTGSVYVNDTQATSACELAAGDFYKYIGLNYTRKFRITYSINNSTTDYSLYLNSELTSFTKDAVVSKSFDWDPAAQRNGSITSSGTTYSTVYRFIGINKYSSIYSQNQILIAQINSSPSASYASPLLNLGSRWSSGSGASAETVLNGQTITITSIQIQE